MHALDATLENGPKAEQTRQVFSEYGLRLEHHSADAFAALLARERQRWASVS